MWAKLFDKGARDLGLNRTTIELKFEILPLSDHINHRS